MEILKVCSNGLVPDTMLVTAFRSCHAKKPFVVEKDGWEALVNFKFFCLKIRQLCGKIRELVSDMSAWETLAKKMSTAETNAFLRCCRCLKESFMVESAASSMPEIRHTRAEANFF